MLVRYRHYTSQEMVDMLARERIYFSHSHSVVRGRHKPDAIFLTVQRESGQGIHGTIAIGCESFNHSDGVVEIFKSNNFACDEATGRFFKLWTIAYHRTGNGMMLLDKVMDSLAAAQESSPFLLYASPQQKGIADYHRFMRSPLPKVSYGEVMQALGYWDDCQGTTGEKETDTEIDYLVAPYKRGWWAAWASGDLIVPLFAFETEAVRFLRARAACDPLAKITVRSIPAYRRNKRPNPYVLVDRTKNMKERVAWLQGEIARLQRLSRTANYRG